MTTTDDRAARLRALGWTDEELRLLAISDRAEGYKPSHGNHARRRTLGPQKLGSKPQSLSPVQIADALRLRAQGRSWTWIGAFMHLSHKRLERECSERAGA